MDQMVLRDEGTHSHKRKLDAPRRIHRAPGRRPALARGPAPPPRPPRPPSAPHRWHAPEGGGRVDDHALPHQLRVVVLLSIGDGLADGRHAWVGERDGVWLLRWQRAQPTRACLAECHCQRLHARAHEWLHTCTARGCTWSICMIVAMILRTSPVSVEMPTPGGGGGRGKQTAGRARGSRAVQRLRAPRAAHGAQQPRSNPPAGMRPPDASLARALPVDDATATRSAGAVSNKHGRPHHNTRQLSSDRPSLTLHVDDDERLVMVPAAGQAAGRPNDAPVPLLRGAHSRGLSTRGQSVRRQRAPAGPRATTTASGCQRAGRSQAVPAAAGGTGCSGPGW